MDTKYKKTDPKSTLPLAVAYVTKHPSRYLFPLAAGRKGKPLIKDNLAKASNDPRQLAAWSKQFGSDIAWGCATKKSGLICLDIDCGPGKEGKSSFETLRDLEGLPFPKTETQRSPSGGYHMLYKGEHFFSASKVGLHMDTPNYFCIAGVERGDGRKYSMHYDVAVIAAPAWLVEKIKPRANRPRADRAADAVPLDWFKRALAATPYTDGPKGLDDRRAYQGWLEFAMACHEAAGGDEADYMWAFIDWSLADPQAKESWSAESIERHWQSFTADPAQGSNAVTRASWCKVLDDTGKGKSIVSELSASDFAADPVTIEDVAQWQKTEAEKRRKRSEKKRERSEQQRKASGGASSTMGGLHFLDADKLESRNISFLYPLRLARGKHTMLAGEAGKGKSQIAYDTVARLTTGAAWPDGSGKAPIGRVIILSAEDGPNDVVTPRLIATGANRLLIKIVKASITDKGERKFNLQEDMAKLRAAITELNATEGPPVVLVVFDPISSYMGGTVDSFHNTQVRHVLDPITDLAEEMQCAVLSISHFNKGTSAKAVNRVLDSVAFTAAPRAAFGVFDDPEDIGSDFDETRRFLFLPMKTNIGKFAPGLKYHIEESQGGTDSAGNNVATSKIVWDGLTTTTADQVSQAEQEQGRNAPRLKEAIKFLSDELADGPKLASEVQERAEAEAIAPDTLRRAKRKLKVKAEPVTGKGPGAGWQWSLSERFKNLDMSAATTDAPDPDPLSP